MRRMHFLTLALRFSRLYPGALGRAHVYLSPPISYSLSLRASYPSLSLLISSASSAPARAPVQQFLRAVSLSENCSHYYHPIALISCDQLNSTVRRGATGKEVTFSEQQFHALRVESYILIRSISGNSRKFSPNTGELSFGMLPIRG